MTGEHAERRTLRTFMGIARFLKPYLPTYLLGLMGLGFVNLFVNAFLARILMELTAGVMSLSREAVGRASFLMAAGMAGTVVWVVVSVTPFLRASLRAQNDMRREVFGKFITMPLSSVRKEHSADLISRLTTSVSRSGSLFHNDLQMATNTLFSGVGAMVLMVSLHPKMAFVGILASALPLVVAPIFSRPMKAAGLEDDLAKASFTQSMGDVLAGRDTIRHMNLSGLLAERTDAAAHKAKGAGMRLGILESARQAADGLASAASIGFLLYVVYVGLHDRTQIPIAVAMIQLADTAKSLFSSIGQIWVGIQSGIGSAERVLDVLETPSEPQQIPRPEVAQATTGDSLFAVKGLSFSYTKDGPPTVDQVTFTLPEGEVVAVVGPSGGGKSTLIKVLLGLYPPGAGDVRVSGGSIYDMPLRQWRSQFSYVPQDAFLFSGTVYDNILGGTPDPGREKVVEAAVLANAHDFITAMPQGYDSLVSEKASNLSGGQKQRIAIARAFLHDAPILLLDEATSALDAESEALVQAALSRLVKGRTTLVVAHRLGTVRSAHEILVMAEGQIVERGDHGTLLAEQGLYARLVKEGQGGTLRQGT